MSNIMRGDKYFMRKNCKLIRLTKIQLISLIIITAITGCSSSNNINNENNVAVSGNSEIVSQDYNSNSFNINVSLNYNIVLDDKVKGVNSNIIRATRQAIFDTDCDFARLQHYNGYSKNNDVLIFDVKENGKDTWKVDFKEKKAGTKEYDNIGYSFATVKKQKSGSYIGYIVHSSPLIREGETY